MGEMNGAKKRDFVDTSGGFSSSGDVNCSGIGAQRSPSQRDFREYPGGRKRAS